MYSSFNVETRLVTDSYQVIDILREGLASGEMFVMRIGSEFKNVAQHGPTFTAGRDIRRAHRPGDSDDRLPVRIIGIVNQGTAIWAGFDLTTTFGRC